jgi:radical SAM superfamily enzyme YgiQ (UPF0313 family)
LDKINAKLPWIRRIGLYANAKSIKMKTDAELRELADRKLGIVYLGVESGDDVTLKRINKGADAETMLTQGRRIVKAGVKLSVTVLLGIGGKERWREHAQATGRLLTQMDPDYVGALTVMVIPGTPLADQQARGEFELPGPMEILAELREMVAHTDLSRGMFFSNHASNYLPLKIRYPDGKQRALEAIDSALGGQVGLKPEWLRAL